MDPAGDCAFAGEDPGSAEIDRTFAVVSFTVLAVSRPANRAISASKFADSGTKFLVSVSKFPVSRIKESNSVPNFADCPAKFTNSTPKFAASAAKFVICASDDAVSAAKFMISGSEFAIMPVISVRGRIRGRR